MPLPRLGTPRVRLRRTTDQAIAAGHSRVAWSTADYDDFAMWNGVELITVDRAGLWMLQATVLLDAVAPSFIATVRWRRNGVDLPQSRSVSNTTANQVSNFHIVELDAGDALDVDVQRSNASASAIKGNETWCHVVRIGPVRYV